MNDVETHVIKIQNYQIYENIKIDASAKIRKLLEIIGIFWRIGEKRLQNQSYERIYVKSFEIFVH